MDKGSLCSLALLFPSHSLWMESRSDTGGNRVEIQESASLQLGSDVTKFRVAAAEVDRHSVSSNERRDSRAGIYRAYRAYMAIYLSTVLLLLFFLFYTWTDEILHRDCRTKLILLHGAN